MEKFILLLLILFSKSNPFAQTTISALKHDFGQITPQEIRYVDLILSSSGEKKHFLLRIKNPKEVVYKLKGKELSQDSSIIIRFQVNPNEKGTFKYAVEVFTSDRNVPYLIELSGTMTEKPNGDLSQFQACPSFGTIGVQSISFPLTVKVLDAETKVALERAKIYLVQNGRTKNVFTTDKDGMVVEQFSTGFSYFYFSKEGYLSAEKGAYFNSVRNELTIELKKAEIASNNHTITTTEGKPVSMSLFKSRPNALPSKKPEEVLEQEIKKEQLYIPESLDKLSINDFTEKNFKAVNVTFVLDLSSSMKAEDKMELMKFSLNALNRQLRACDKVSMVTYSDNARVILPPITGADKQNMEKVVDDLKASGMTAGGEGIRLGYEENYKGLLADGVNHVVVITDGAFNRNSKNYKKYVKRYRAKGIMLSIVGIRNSVSDSEKMKIAASLGGGRFVGIENLADAQNNLFQEIRVASYRY